MELYYNSLERKIYSDKSMSNDVDQTNINNFDKLYWAKEWSKINLYNEEFFLKNFDKYEKWCIIVLEKQKTNKKFIFATPIPFAGLFSKVCEMWQYDKVLYNLEEKDFSIDNEIYFESDKIADFNDGINEINEFLEKNADFNNQDKEEYYNFEFELKNTKKDFNDKAFVILVKNVIL